MTAFRNLTGSAFVALLILGAQVASGTGEPELRYKVKYDLEIYVGLDSRSFGSRINVPAGRAIPVQIEDYRAEITISETAPGFYETEIILQKAVGDGESQEHVARFVVPGEDGEFISFSWQSMSTIAVKFEITASGDRR